MRKFVFEKNLFGPKNVKKPSFLVISNEKCTKSSELDSSKIGNIVHQTKDIFF